MKFWVGSFQFQVEKSLMISRAGLVRLLKQPLYFPAFWSHQSSRYMLNSSVHERVGHGLLCVLFFYM